MFVRVEYNYERKFVEIKDINTLTIENFPALVVNVFQIKNARGKKVYVHDQLDTRIHETAELKFLLQTQISSLVLKVKFVAANSRGSISQIFTTKVNTSYIIIFEWIDLGIIFFFLLFYLPIGHK